MEHPHVVQLTLNYNRYTLMQRNLKSFLDQDYIGNHTLVIWNTGSPLKLGDFHIPNNKKVILMNSNLEYSSVGAKYNEAVMNVPYCQIINFLDSDDFALPHNITNGVIGLNKAILSGKEAYKPYFNFFLNGSGCNLNHNVHEGAIFLSKNYLDRHTFLDNSVKYHDGWLLPLIQNDLISVEKDGKPGWVYTWGESIPTYKMSGREDTKGNFISSQQLQNDTGNGKDLVPLTDKEMNHYYNIVKSVHS